MNEWLPYIAAIGLGVPLAAIFRFSWVGAAFLCAGFCSLLLYIGH